MPVQQVQTQANPPLVGHIVTAISNAARDITENQNTNYRQLHDELVAQLKTPAPVPAYTVPNPNGYYGGQQNCYQSCGC